VQRRDRQLLGILSALTGLAYTGHSIWVFEGHSSALVAIARGQSRLL
jgi:hypothetical protein